jgi:hypothetical protein
LVPWVGADFAGEKLILKNTREKRQNIPIFIIFLAIFFILLILCLPAVFLYIIRGWLFQFSKKNKQAPVLFV